jgi:hypothetical protein
MGDFSKSTDAEFYACSTGIYLREKYCFACLIVTLEFIKKLYFELLLRFGIELF